VDLAVAAGPADLERMKASIEEVHVSESIGRYIVSIVEATRSAPRVLVGASPRGSLALLRLSRAKAALAGRDFVTPEDVKALAVPALAHRLTMRPEAWVAGVKEETVVGEVLERVPTPAPDPERHAGP
jgi:MoxR-like ATPase